MRSIPNIITVLLVSLTLHPGGLLAQTYTWKKLDTAPYPGKQDDIAFVDKNTGWYVNGYGRIYHTTDGGTTWNLRLEQEGTFFRTIAFISPQVGFAGTVGTDYFPNVTDSIPLYGTQDGGKTWTPVDYEGSYVKGLCGMEIVTEPFINHGVLDTVHHIFAVGRVGGPAMMLASHDSGTTWQATDLNQYSKMLLDIKMFDQNEGIACGASHEDITQSHAQILRTTDGGQTWQTVYESDRPYETTWKAAFPSPEVGYVTIQSYNPDSTVNQQRIAKTTDGGRNWTEIALVKDHTAREFGIGFIDEDHGYVGTMTSGYETQNGGETWQPVDLGKACNKIRIYRNEQGEVYGYAIGVDVFKLEQTK